MLKYSNKSKVGSCLKKENKYAQTSTKLNANKVNQLNIVTETNLASTQSSTNNNINNTVNNDYVVVKDDYNKLSEVNSFVILVLS